MNHNQGVVRWLPCLLAILAGSLLLLSCSTTADPTGSGPEPGDEATADSPASAGGDSSTLFTEQPQVSLSQQRKVLGQSYAESARRSYDAGDLEGAYNDYAKALELDPSNEELKGRFEQLGSQLGYQGDSVSAFRAQTENRTLVRMQEAKIEIDNRWGKAQMAMAAEDYETAVSELEVAIQVYEWFPYDLNVDLEKGQVEGALAEAKMLAAEKAIADARTREMDILREKDSEAGMAEERLNERIDILFAESDNAFSRADYHKAEQLLREILRLDYENARAEDLLTVAVEARHRKVDAETTRAHREEWKRNFEDIKTGLVPMTEHIQFPENWAEIAKRKPREFRDADAAVSAEEQEIRNKLSRTTVAPVFEDAPLRDVAQFFQNVTGVNFVVSAAVNETLSDDEAVVTLGDLRPLPADDLLNIVTQVKSLVWKVEDGVVKITTQDDLSKDMRLELYNVRDLVNPINDFPGEEISLQPASGGGLFDEEIADEESDSAAINSDRLIQLIQENIAPDAWDPPASVDAKSGTLVVRQSDEVHGQIVQLLDDLRRTTGVLVAIEARFLSVEDNFLEDVGVDLRGLGDDSGGTGVPGRGGSRPLDDFGAPTTGFGTPDSPSGIGTGNDSGVFYNDFGDGNVRARVENLFDMSLGSEDTLTNSGGFSAQYTYLDDTQVEAVFRAVRKSERNQSLTAPRLLVSNNERASISVINEVSYVKDFDVEIAQAATIADPIIDVVRDGVILDVKPVVSADRQFVTLELRPTVSVLERPIPTFATTLGTGPPVAIEIPTLRVQRVRTTVTMPDNSTLLLGGLKTAEERTVQSGVPFLRDIPLLSFLFGRKGTFTAHKNLLILLKARIIVMNEYEPIASGPENY